MASPKRLRLVLHGFEMPRATLTGRPQADGRAAHMLLKGCRFIVIIGLKCARGFEGAVWL